MKHQVFSQYLSVDTYLETEFALFLDAHARFISTEELCEVFAVTEFTARKILRLLNEHIKEYDEEGYELILSPAKGAKLLVPVESDLKLFFIFLVKQDARVHAIDAVVHKRFRSIANYAKLTHTSEATARRTVEQVNLLLKPLALSIAKRSFEFEGEERQLQLFLMRFYWRSSRGLVWPFDSVVEAKIKRVVQVLEETGVIQRLSPIDRRRMMFVLAIFKVRKQENNKIHYETLLPYERELFQLRRVLEEERFVQLLSADECCFLFSLFNAFAWLPERKKLLDRDIVYDLPAGRATAYVMEKLAPAMTELSALSKEQIEESLYSAHLFAQEQTNFDTDTNGYNYERLLTTYMPETIEHLTRFLRQAREDTGLSLFEETNFLLIYYCPLWSLLPQGLSLERHYLLYLETSLPALFEQLLAKQIEDYFHAHYNLTVCTSNEQVAPETVDIFLTTIPLNDFSKIYPIDRTIAISRTLSFADFHKIEAMIKQRIK